MPPRLTRRGLFLLGAAALGAANLPAAAFAAGDEFGVLRSRALALLTGEAVDPADPVYARALGSLEASAAAAWDTMDRGASRTRLWADLPLGADPAGFGQSYTRLRSIGLAWATPGTPRHGDEEVAAALLSALDLLYDRAYNETRRETGNWWFWEIGAPRALMDTCVLLGDRIPADRLAAYLRAVDRFCPDPDRRVLQPSLSETGANRADKAMIVALRGILGRDAAKLALARDGLSDVRDGGRRSLFAYVTSGDGFYRDGSFLQHGSVAYTGSYGAVLLSAVAQLVGLLGGSRWRVTDPAQAVILDAVEASFAPVMRDGLVMDHVRGRAVSRQAQPDAAAGHGVITSVLLLAQGAPEPYASRFRALAKGWIERGTHRPYLEHAGVPAIARARAVLDDPAITPAPRPVGHFVFPDMDRVVHHRPGWSFAISLSSRRIAAYEAGNGENLRGWYTGDGMTYLYTDDLGQFGDGFWPTVNAYRLPGTTVDTRERAPLGTGGGTSTYRPANAWAGGAALGELGVAGIELIGHGVTLRARKSWFCLDDAVVALGAGITSGDGRTIETIVENRNLRSGGRLTVDGAAQPGDDGWSGSFDPRWAHVEGVGGYVFPEGGTLRALRESRTGAWRDINVGADTGGGPEPVTRRYLTLWHDHGTNPSGAAYAHVLLPGLGAGETARWAEEPPVRVLSNTADLQAVAAPRLGLTAAVFWAAGSLKEVSADAPAAVLVRRHAGRISVAVSDPSRTVATVTLVLRHPAHGVERADETIEVTPGRNPRLTVAVGGSRGRTHTAVLRVGGG
ncbi:polysaccharide lyase 8 family protein [Bailinhaonella thermotolerans]|uniref:Hyaluronate lyase n=1 Tax=Bailinhaonella thermotolerans TaxID=1070861 RepID=A0A3A4B5W1_9ACTN|nr:polysaccharide lyase 8 family protein [Bailinhaonella thermotolerans]RJL32792.1 hypothetical protein D5H75_15125 [Bailinhaonella thermotolerans]